MLVLKCSGNRSEVAALYVGHRAFYGGDARVGFRARRDEYNGVGERNLRLGQSDLKRDVTGGFDYGDNLRVGETDIFAGADEETAYRGDQVACLEQAGEVVERRVRVGAAHGFLVS